MRCSIFSCGHRFFSHHFSVDWLFGTISIKKKVTTETGAIAYNEYILIVIASVSTDCRQ